MVKWLSSKRKGTKTPVFALGYAAAGPSLSSASGYAFQTTPWQDAEAGEDTKAKNPMPNDN